MVLNIPLQTWLCNRLSKGHPSPRQRSTRGSWLPTLGAALGVTLTASPTAAPTSASRMTSTAMSAAGLGASSWSTSISPTQSLNITLKCLSSV